MCLQPVMSEDQRLSVQQLAEQGLTRNWVSWKQILPTLSSWADLVANLGERLSQRAQLHRDWTPDLEEMHGHTNGRCKPLGLTGHT